MATLARRIANSLERAVPTFGLFRFGIWTLHCQSLELIVFTTEYSIPLYSTPSCPLLKGQRDCGTGSAD